MLSLLLAWVQTRQNCEDNWHQLFNNKNNLSKLLQKSGSIQSVTKLHDQKSYP